jgi:mannose-6-phosphate isomerase-like protein (cupin superfamily)
VAPVWRHGRDRRGGPWRVASIPLGARFQLRNDGAEPLAAVAITMPPWPGEDEACLVEGKWPATVDD